MQLNGHLALAVVCALACGCGVGHLQTAKTTPRGHLDVTMGWGYIYNKAIKMRKEANAEDGGNLSHAFANFPLIINSRLGILDQLDIGLKLYMMIGALADVKYNFMPAAHPLAVSVQSGIGIEKTVLSEGAEKAWSLQIPVFALVSYTVKKIFTPYASLGYGIFWIFGRKGIDPSMDYEDRKGYGDGVLMAGAGFEVNLTENFSLLLEYNYWHPLQDDPGDKYSFLDNHIILAGLRLRAQIFGRKEPKTLPKPELEPPPPPPPPKPPRPTLTPPSGPPPKKARPGTPEIHTHLL